MYEYPIPIAFPEQPSLTDGDTVLAADIGGTKTHLALFKIRGDEITLIEERKYPSQKWHSLTNIVKDFKVEAPELKRFSIAFAGPVQEGKAKATNLDWEIDVRQLGKTIDVDSVLLINDLEAVGYGLAALREEDIAVVYDGDRSPNGNAAIIAPGTGLGEAGMFWDGHAFHPFATEGGHTDFASTDELDVELFQFLNKKYGHVSWERVVSGPGIHAIFQFLRDVRKMEQPAWLKERMQEGDPSAAISKAAEEGCPICQETLRLFIKYLSQEASDLALKFKATGGVFIGGGIPPKIWNEELQKEFLDQFFHVGRLRHLLETMPVYLILNSKAALLGAAYYGALGSKEGPQHFRLDRASMEISTTSAKE